MKRAVSAALVLACCVALASRASADAASARAQFERGRASMDAGRLDEARRYFEASLRDSPQPATAYNLAVVRDAMGRPADAERIIDALRRGRYGVLSAPGLAQIDALSARVRTRVAVLQIEAPISSGTIVRVDGEPVAGAVGDGALAARVDPGRHVVTVRAADGRSAERAVHVGYGAVARVTIALPPPLTTRPDDDGPSAWLWIGIGGAAVAVGVGVVLAVVLSSEQDPIRDDVWPVAPSLTAR